MFWAKLVLACEKDLKKIQGVAQGGIFLGNLGTRFPGNPWSQAKYLLAISPFLFDIQIEEN
jgi:hypothetical protein